MNYNIPDNITNLGQSQIRVFFEKASKIEGCIPFGIGNPAAEAIPQKEIIEAMTEAVTESPLKVMQYGPATGYEPLVEFTLKQLENKGIKNDDNGIMILGGSGQGLGLLPRTICNKGDVVFADEFTFPNGPNAAKAVGCSVEAIKMDEKGMIPSELEKAIIKADGKGKYIYLIPNFQNPKGSTMPLDRRKELYALAQKHDLLIYEDDPYGEIRFAGDVIPNFMSFDVDGRVVLAGSYSKVLSAGLRVGYLYANKELIMRMSNVRNSSDGQGPLLNQMIVYNCLSKLDYTPYIQNICDIYGRKCKVMLNSIEKYCSLKLFTYVKPEGGMFLWVELPKEIVFDEFFEKCLENGVGVIGALGFATNPEDFESNAFRLNYTAISDEDIVEGIKRLGKVSFEFEKKLGL